jgi:hypothetical protein
VIALDLLVANLWSVLGRYNRSEYREHPLGCYIHIFF